MPNLAVRYIRSVENEFYNLGYDTLKTPLGDVDLKRMQEAGAGVKAAQRDVPDAAAALKELAPKLPQSARDEVEKIASSLDSSAAELAVPAKLLDTAAQPQQANQQAQGSREGWIYVGHVDESKQNWSPNPTIVRTPSPQFKRGDVLTITDDVYILG